MTVGPCRNTKHKSGRSGKHHHRDSRHRKSQHRKSKAKLYDGRSGKPRRRSRAQRIKRRQLSTAANRAKVRKVAHPRTMAAHSSTRVAKPGTTALARPIVKSAALKHKTATRRPPGTPTMRRRKGSGVGVSKVHRTHLGHCR